MENKKLINILQKDMEELEALIADMKIARQYDSMAMELAHNRARSIMQLIQLLEDKQNENHNTQTTATDPTTATTSEPEENSIDPGDFLQPNQASTTTEPFGNATSERDEMNQTAQETLTKEESASEPESPGNHIDSRSEDDDMLEDDPEKRDTQVRLIDSFMKGKSVNDLVTDQQKLEFKLSNRPVTSIQKAIGINDRFQFIRELFDNDNEKFLQTVKSLDSMNTMTDALHFLRNHFKWHKSETSLKFLNLVKRRFADETSMAIHGTNKQD